MPSWLKETEAETSGLSRYGRSALIWGGALLAVAAVAAGGMWLRGEQKAHSELDAIAMSSRAADASILAGAPPAPVVPQRRDVKIPPMVTLSPDGSAVVTPPAEPSATKPAPAAPAPVAAAPAPVVAEKAPAALAGFTAPAAPAPAVKPAPKVAAAKPAVVKAPAKAAPKERRVLAAAPWPAAPSRKLPLAQNVLPKSKVKPAAGAKAKVAKATKAAPAPRKAVLAKAKVQPKKVVAGVTLPPSRPRAAEAPVAREYPRDPVPVPRSCAKGELARDCAN